jgi:putative DNA primase/helicase
MDIDISSGVHKNTNLPDTVEETLKFLNTFRLQPSLIVFSGGGIHSYWLFKEVWYFDNTNERL